MKQSGYINTACRNCENSEYGSFNKIEGIYTSDERLKALVKDTTRPKSRNEQEIAGYRDVLNTIHDNHDYIPPKPSIILQTDRDLYKFEGFDIGGKYKTADNIIEEEDMAGNKSVRFQPMPAWATPEAIEELCKALDEALATEQIDPLILIPMFILDFLCIHPFNDGNGRMSRLLTLLLLYRAGYIVGKYISIEKLIENTKELYYDCLQQSSVNWHENKNDYEPFVKYMLGIVTVKAYREFFIQSEFAGNKRYVKAGQSEGDHKNNTGYHYKSRDFGKMSGYQSGDSTEGTCRAGGIRENFENRWRKIYKIYME